MKVSIMIPCYNAEAYIGEALASALTSARPQDELVVQDGGSTDRTVRIVEECAAKDPRVLLDSRPDGGQSSALNAALGRSTGEFALWMNADDLLREEGYMWATSQAENGRHDLVIGGHQTLRANGSVIRSYEGAELSRHRLLVRGCYVFSGSMLIRTDMLREVGGFGVKHEFSMDLDLMLRICGIPTLTQACGDLPLGTLRWHGESKSGSQGPAFLRDSWNVRRMHSRGPTDLTLSAAGLAIQSAALHTTRIRHTPLYAKVRSWL